MDAVLFLAIRFGIQMTLFRILVGRYPSTLACDRRPSNLSTMKKAICPGSYSGFWQDIDPVYKEPSISNKAPFIDLFINLLMYSLIYPLICSFITHSFVHSLLVHLFTHYSFIYSFITRSFIH